MAKRRHFLQRLFLPKEEKVVNCHQVPSYLRFNRFIWRFYRPIGDTEDCVKSVCRLHNETVNIWTHGIASVVLLISLPFIIPWSDPNIPLLHKILHAQATVMPWIGSTMYHTFMNHQSGFDTYRTLLACDVAAVWMAQALGSLNPIYFGIYCFQSQSLTVLITFYVIINLQCLYKACRAQSAFERSICFSFVFLVRMAVLFCRINHNGATRGGNPEANYHLLMQDLLTIVGVILGSLRIPERFYPGRFDLAFNSHNWMHVLAVCGASHMHQAVTKDFQWLAQINSGNVTNICDNKTGSADFDLRIMTGERKSLN